MMWSIVQVWSTSKTILKFCDWSNRVLCMMKTRQDNDVIDDIGVVYIENDTELS